MKKRTRPVKLAIIGTGGMANAHAERFAKVENCQIVGACDVDLERATAFCEKHRIPKAFATVEEMLTKSKCEAVTIVTPDPFHAPLSIQCLKAGVINMVNLSYRDWPAIQAVAGLIHSGGIGEVRHVEASYLQAWLASKIWGDWRTTPAWLWRLSSKHGSKGVLGDVGVHIVDFATFPAGPISSVYCRLKAFAKAPRNRVGEYTLDANDSAVLNVEFANGALGTIHTTRWCGGHANRLFLKIAGTLGTVEIDSDRSTSSYRICAGEHLDTGAWQEVAVAPTLTNYARFVQSILTGVNDQPDFARGAAVQKVLDACFVSDAEKRPVRV